MKAINKNLLSALFGMGIAMGIAVSPAAYAFGSCCQNACSGVIDDYPGECLSQCVELGLGRCMFL